MTSDTQPDITPIASAAEVEAFERDLAAMRAGEPPPRAVQPVEWPPVAPLSSPAPMATRAVVAAFFVWFIPWVSYPALGNFNAVGAVFAWACLWFVLMKVRERD